MVTDYRKVIDDPEYTPNRLMNHVRDTLGLKSNFAVARTLNIDDACLSRIIHRHQYVTNKVLIAILDAIPEMTIAEVRKLAGQPKAR